MEIFLIIGMLTVSFALTYAWWCKVRVIRLRQDIFDRRDELFDLAAKLAGHSDPAYKDARRQLNTIASVADTISIPVFLYWIYRGERTKREVHQHADPQMQAAIDEALMWCAERVARYLLRETLDGVFLMLRFWISGIPQPIKAGISDVIEEWVNSETPRKIESYLSAQGRATGQHHTQPT